LASPDYEVFALRYASHIARSSRENFLGEDPLHDTDMPLDFYVWLIRGDARLVLVDTGFSAAMAAKRGRHYHAHPKALLETLGIRADEVTDVVLTHMHYDHAGNIDAFPRATFHLQEAELHYCTGRCMCHAPLRGPYEPMDIANAIFRLHEGRLRFAGDNGEIAPGISLHLCGGHTAGLQFVRVMTARGPVVLASDAAHYWQNIRRRHPFPIVLNVAQMLDGYHQMEALAAGPDHIIPGHDPLVLSTFPAFRSDPNIVALHQVPIAPSPLGAA
jgi:glyoxylase-like metal-dependent hydrolase (beta-lactamase superfamily II)